MKLLDEATVRKLRQEYPKGTKVRLVQMDDPQAPDPGTLGTVYGVDDTGSLLVTWENGSGLHVLYGIDVVEKVVPPDKKLMRYIPKEFKELVVKIYEGNRYWDEVTRHWSTELVVEWESGWKSEFANKTYAWNVLHEFHSPDEYRKEN